MLSGNWLFPLSLKVLISLSLLQFNFISVLSNHTKTLRYHFHQRCYKIKWQYIISYYITVRALIWSWCSSAVNYLFPKINDKTILKYSLFPVQSGVQASKKPSLLLHCFIYSMQDEFFCSSGEGTGLTLNNLVLYVLYLALFTSASRQVYHLL